MFTIPNQSSVIKVYQEFHEAGMMKDSPYRDLVVGVMEELYKFTLLLREQVDYLIERYSERKEQTTKAGAEVASGALSPNTLPIS